MEIMNICCELCSVYTTSHTKNGKNSFKVWIIKLDFKRRDSQNISRNDIQLFGLQVSIFYNYVFCIVNIIKLYINNKIQALRLWSQMKRRIEQRFFLNFHLINHSVCLTLFKQTEKQVFLFFFFNRYRVFQKTIYKGFQGRLGHIFQS